MCAAEIAVDENEAAAGIKADGGRDTEGGREGVMEAERGAGCGGEPSSITAFAGVR